MASSAMASGTQPIADSSVIDSTDHEPSVWRTTPEYQMVAFPIFGASNMQSLMTTEPSSSAAVMGLLTKVRGVLAASESTSGL